jgi:hypothetical protein
VVETNDEVDAWPQKISPRHIPLRVDHEVLRESFGKPIRWITVARIEKCGVVSIRKVALIKPELEAVNCQQDESGNERDAKDDKGKRGYGLGFANSDRSKRAHKASPRPGFNDPGMKSHIVTFLLWAYQAA